ncbi:MAG: sporulation protein YqfD [Clostridium sp.]|nr:sporulation protein YqfD [Clostridium sp.]
MLLKLLRYFFGYVKAEIYGFAPERFMNLLIHNEIVVWDVEHTEKGYIFYTGRRNLLNMRQYLQKTNMKLKILEKRGLPYFFKKNKKRAVFLAGFILAGLLLYILSLFIWEVQVIGEDHLVAESILKQIEKKYVSLGTKKTDVNCAKLEEQLRKDFEEISWVSCELKGTGLTVYLEEGMAPQKRSTDIETGDIVATKDAVITKMITRAGTPIVKVKDSVKKGDILISGTIYIYDDSNEVLETSYIAADGDVYGTTVHPYEDYVDLQYYQKKYSEKSHTYITFYFLDYCFTPYMPKAESKDYDTYTEIHKARILDYFYLPFGYKTMKRTCYTLELKKRAKEDAEKILKERMQKKIASFKEKGVEIIKNDVTIKEVDGKMTATGTFTVTESITELKKAAGNTEKAVEDKEK